MRSFSGKKTISSSSFLGWLVGRGAVKTLIDWYVRRRAAPPPRSSTVCGSNGWLLAVGGGSSSSGAMCMCVCHRSSSKRAAAAVGCPAEKPSESPITARPILESCRRPLFFYIHVSHFEICSTFSAWLDILSAFPPRHAIPPLLGSMHGNMCVAMICLLL